MAPDHVWENQEYLIDRFRLFGIPFIFIALQCMGVVDLWTSQHRSMWTLSQSLKGDSLFPLTFYDIEMFLNVLSIVKASR